MDPGVQIYRLAFDPPRGRADADAVVGAIERGDSVADGEVDGLPVQLLLEFDNEVL